MDTNKIAELLKDYNFEIISEDGKKKEIIIKVGEKAVKLADIPNGGTFKIGKREFIKLGEESGGVAALLKNFLFENSFGGNNDYSASDVREKINEDFYNELEKEVGENNIIGHHVSLVSLDGLSDYDIGVTDKVSLLDVDRYRKYRKYIPNYGDWWWLATPWSCKSNGYSSFVCCVSDDGALDLNGCDYSHGVRPFCIFNSSIFVSNN